MPKKILLADDSITIQKVVELTFSDGDYEVIATNNGAKAIAKLAETRPDIILSDIIMPEKNGYEVCEYVKSHPEYRHIPVILLTGTFEPFDPDRAEKAGCDAVVTKPFESQSLIHKVEDLIASSQPAAKAPPAAAAPPPSPFEEEAAFQPPAEPATPAASPFDEPATATDWPAVTAPQPVVEESPFATPAEERPVSWQSPLETAPADDLFAPAAEAQPEEPAFATHGDDLFAAASRTEEAGAIDFQEPPSFETPDLAPSAFEGEKPTPFEMSEPEPAPPSQPDWAIPAEEEVPVDTTTQMIPKLSLDAINKAHEEMGWQREETPRAEEPIAEAAPAEETPWEAPEAEAPAPQLDWAAAEPQPAAPEIEGERAVEETVARADLFEEPVSQETKMLPKLTFDDIQRMRGESEAAAPPEEPLFEEPQAGSGVAGIDWEAPAAASEFPRAVPPLDEGLGSVAQFEPRAEAEPLFEEPASTRFEEEPTVPRGEEPAPMFGDAPSFEEPSLETPAAAPWEAEETPFEGEAAVPAAAEQAVAEEVPFGGFEEPAPSAEAEVPQREEAAEEAASLWAAPESSFEAPVAEPEISEAAEAPEAPRAAEVPGAAAFSGELTDEQVDRIARRVVELMSKDLVRTIAWEVIPDMAEMIVRERIRQLEAEA